MVFMDASSSPSSAPSETSPSVLWYCSPAARDWAGPGWSSGARAFHRTLPGFEATPLVEVAALAAELGVGRVFVKDESSRLALPAFKVLGASWACRQVLTQRPGATLVTATDGNHGRAVARMASYFGVAATVFVPRVMLPETADRIAEEGATLEWVDGDYDTAVRRAAEFAAAEPGRALVQDTAWEGYEQVPEWIVEGYQTLLEEVDDQLAAAVGRPADLVAVPVGVGSLAEAVVRHHRRPDSARPTVLAVEPDTAACVLTSLTEGRPASVPTAATVMAGLNCGTVSTSAWPILQQGCDAAVAVTDAETLRAVDDLDQFGISSGPSGAATLAGVRAVLSQPHRRRALHHQLLGNSGDGGDGGGGAIVVLLSTEGLNR